MSDNNYNPFFVKLEEVYISKFNTQAKERLNIMPQVIEFVLYQSIFSPLLRGDLVISDYIGLMNNYPLTGEETVEVVVSQQDRENTTLTFVISSIREIVVSDDARQMTYIMELASKPAFINAKTRVSEAFQPQPAEKIITKIYNDYVEQREPGSKKFVPLLETKDVTLNQPLIVPKLKPLDAITWVCQYAVSTNYQNYYTPIFFETIEDFRFKALQQITYKDETNEEIALSRLEREKFIYVSNIENIKKIPDLYENLTKRGFDETRLIGDLRINKRYSGLEKIVGGYFENELIEINPAQLSYENTYTSISSGRDNPNNAKIKTTTGEVNFPFNTIRQGRDFHTPGYIENIKNEYTEEESSARLHYMINLFDGVTFRNKFGMSSRSFLAFQQVDLSITIPSDLTIKPGDFMYAEFPEFHGFNANEVDTYLSGRFLISEVKNIFRQGGKSQTYLRINRDSFNNSEGLDVRNKYDI